MGLAQFEYQRKTCTSATWSLSTCRLEIDIEMSLGTQCQILVENEVGNKEVHERTTSRKRKEIQ